MQRRRLLATGLAAAAAPAGAQDFPAPTLRLIVPFTPGGSNDLMARLIAERLGARWGRPFVVENRPGAAGHIGTEAVMRSAPDGATWLFAPNQVLTTNPLTQRTGFDPLRGLALAARVARVQTLLVAHPALPARSVRELVALARERPGVFSYPSSGVGSFQHFGLARLVGEDMVHVPYGGAAALMPDLLANRVHAFCGALNSLLPHVRAGSLRPLAAMTPGRATLLPEVPTIAEAGFPGEETEIWAGIALAGATPRPIIAQVQAALAALFAEPDIVARLAEQGIEPAVQDAAQFAATVRAELAANGALVRRLGIHPG
jgi:tripartite-type tricarboxylate transporter receptor subunit TctC